MEQIVIVEEVRISVHHSAPRSRTLQPLMASNREGLKAWQYGVWEYEPPNHLSAYIHDRGPYSQAIDIINNISKEQPWCGREVLPTLGSLVLVVVCALFTLGVVSIFTYSPVAFGVISVIYCLVTIPSVVAVNRKHKAKRVVQELQKAVGQANYLLLGNKIVLGTECNSILTVVYVCVSDCKEEDTADDIFKKMVLDYSCSYACCFAKERFPFSSPKEPGHLQGGVCFCQYVNRQNCCIQLRCL